MPTKEENNPPEEIEVKSASEIQPLQRPNPFLYKWAQKGSHFDIINTPQEATQEKPLKEGQATVITGFPDITMKSVLQGGVPPWGQDHNGILYKITEGIQWTQAGGLPIFDQYLCGQIGGYPIGTILQTIDTTRPWILWQNTIDGNTNNPDKNNFSIAQVQNGWVRYPVISGAEGSILYFTDEDGKLEAASEAITSTKYVSSSIGSDGTGDGSIDNPFFSIAKALSAAPSAGSVEIKLMAQDTHYWTLDGTNLLNGTLRKGADWLFVYSMNVTFSPYNDPVLDEVINIAQTHFADGNQGYCAAEVKRPTIVISWAYLETINSSGVYEKSALVYDALNGITNSFSANFRAINFKVENIDGLNNSGYSVTAGWAWNGGNYSFIGCTWDEMPLTEAILGGGGDYSTTYIFSYSNYFSQDIEKQTPMFIGVQSSLTFSLGRNQASGQFANSTYTFMKNNANQLFQKKEAYYGKGVNTVYNGVLNTVNTPSKRYLNINPNFEIL